MTWYQLPYSRAEDNQSNLLRNLNQDQLAKFDMYKVLKEGTPSFSLKNAKVKDRT